LIEMKRSTEMCSTVKHVLSGVQIIFILLKPRSHSAVLTGKV